MSSGDCAAMTVRQTRADSASFVEIQVWSDGFVAFDGDAFAFRAASDSREK